MKIVVAGATGLIGQALIKRLLGTHELVVFTRDIPVARKKLGDTGISYADWHQPPSHLAALIEGTQVLINLAGANVGEKRWTHKRKETILWSRLQTVDMLYTLFQAAEVKLKAVIQASAIGFYGYDEQKAFTESDESGTGFLAEVSTKWEQAATRFQAISERLLFIRSGVVLAHQGGALPKMALPVRLMIGGRIGTGNQWISWIDIEDEIEAILFLLANKHCSGAYNLTAPEPIQQKDFVQIMAKVLKRPSRLTTPAFVIKTVLGEMGKELLLSGTYAKPERLLADGFSFHFKNAEQSLKDKL
ncbi:MAG: TIGR01777 family oxidoreductase [Bacteroidales bacterium]|jgi:uncharacterized protein (TIGR01777 family)|nr:TIGR01777 family oxidoreductase [Bacteroidales bacterium]MDD3700607.1 TIGR01777 family oxidoreductase [Bacteroidales bacterium]MDY0368270.1 TIGR01777 family oxidoreductase [Bacteroidales bacterium]